MHLPPEYAALVPQGPLDLSDEDSLFMLRALVEVAGMVPR